MVNIGLREQTAHQTEKTLAGASTRGPWRRTTEMATSSLGTASTPSLQLSTSAMPFLRMHRVFQERSGGATELRS